MKGPGSVGARGPAAWTPGQDCWLQANYVPRSGVEKTQRRSQLPCEKEAKFDVKM